MPTPSSASLAAAGCRASSSRRDRARPEGRHQGAAARARRAASQLDRFRREIRSPRRLQHPHIVPLLAAGEADGLPYYTMPFVEGESLRARLAPRRRAAGARGHARAARRRRRAGVRARAAASSTATSSPTTSCSPAATRWSPTSASPRRSPPSATRASGGADLARRRARHAGVHGARAGGGRSARRSPGRHLRVRRLAYELLTRRAAVRRPLTRRRCWPRT